MGEEGEAAEVEGWTCCCLALASSIVATCCLTSERAEAEIENKARKEEKRRREFKKIQEDIRRKEEKRRDDERRRKEERRRKDEKKRIEKQQKEEKTKRNQRENDEAGGGHIACGSENIQKLQVVRAANPDINRRDKIQWENKPGNEKHEIAAAKPEMKTTHSTTAVQGNGGDRIDRVGLKQFDNKPNLSAGNHDDQSLQKVNNNKLLASNHSLLVDIRRGGGGGGGGGGGSCAQQEGSLGTKRLQSLHSFDSLSTRSHPSAGEGHPRERLRSIHSLDGGGHTNNGQIGQHGQVHRKNHQGQHGPSNGNGMRDHMTASHQQQIQQKKALAQRQRSSSSGENKNVKRPSGGKLGPGKKK